MMVERHYDDEALIALMESDRDHNDEHLPACAACSEKLESVRMIAEAMKDATVWESQSDLADPVPSTIATLRAFATRMDEEEARAERAATLLLEGPRDRWKSNLQKHPEVHTMGVARLLIARSSKAIDTNPPDALEMTSLAVQIADSLAADRDLSAERLAQLRGAARRERSFAFFYTGRFAEAVAEADRADSEFARCTVDDYERARVGIVRALALRSLERWTPALETARDSVRVFDAFDDLDRSASARLAEVHVLFSLNEFEEAVTILTQLEERLRSSKNLETYARVLPNLGYAYWQLKRKPEALHFYDAAADILKMIGVETEVLRSRWGVATMLADSGDREDALRRLREIAADFERLGMASESTLASLGVAELLLADEKYSEIEEICQRAMRSFERAGISYTARALTALAYMREAAQNRTVTPTIVRHVREYIRRLPAEENLLFVRL